ncbi:class I SAM-dependent methyltransferase [Jiulongibacter sediminis]|jgi:predicted TPR repeat methyltransferase|uniref:class I SAM-dependent DNA methyltransferase n=1 Tax=Jiulongibacter sediminis TaxID=1605367 RepID=UPI0026E9F7C5|nr:class I SAM-dependent methyltransferase [Jiulongibacter sediminis]
MNVKAAYKEWSKQYDSNRNRTRDAEALVLKELLGDLTFKHILEVGCGTGKNTGYLVNKTEVLTAIDLSEEMLAIAKAKIESDKVTFVKTDITEDWGFISQIVDLTTFSLVLEHIENLEPVFQKVAKHSAPNAFIYIGELHPFKQYNGSKARFETEEGTQVVSCFNHHLSDFTRAAGAAGFQLVKLTEYFDENDRKSVPRILGLLFQKMPC